MFSALPLSAAFEHVATSDEWREFRSLGAVTPNDVWVASMAEGRSPYVERVSRYTDLWRRFAARARAKLLSGAWLAEGFDPDKGAQPQAIPSLLWRVLELADAEDHAAGGGYKFVNLHVTSRERAPSASATGSAQRVVQGGRGISMEAARGQVLEPSSGLKDEVIRPMPEEFRDVIGALVALADDAQREAFLDELKAPSIIDEHGGEHRVTLIQDRLLDRLMENLRSGEWVATGFGYESGQPTELHPRLWQRLGIDVSQNCAYDGLAHIGRPSMTGSFHSLGFRAARLSPSLVAHGERARIIGRLAHAMSELDKTLPLDLPKSDFFKHVQHALELSVRPSWLKEAWRRAELSPSRRQPGLKSKQSDNPPSV